MIGILLLILGTIFEEASTSIGKYEVARSRESVYALGFLSVFWAALFLFAVGVYEGHAFAFSLQSLPTFSLRAVLEIILMFITIHAIVAADRSTYSFLRTLTIPLLFGIDFLLGYQLTSFQLTGIALLMLTFVFLFLNRGLGPRGKLLSIATAVGAALTISLYKYDIAHFNSVEAEQSLMYVILLIALLVFSWVSRKENLFRYMLRPLFLFQSLAAGIAAVLVSFAYLLAPASVIAAAYRALSILTSIISGNIYFREKEPLYKLLAFSLISAGIVLLAM